jgi:3-deoxy-D-arabino-heptulosonate 7-phosphate (DAHP) synthase class II
MQVSTKDELKQAVKKLEPEIVVTDEGLVKRIRLFSVLRTVATIAVFVILAAALLMIADPAGWFKGSQEAQLARQIMLGVGILLLFADYLLPVVRVYRIAGQDANGLKLVPRKQK